MSRLLMMRVTIHLLIVFGLLCGFCECEDSDSAEYGDRDQLKVQIHHNGQDVSGKSITLYENDTITLDCTVTDALPNKVEYRWKTGVFDVQSNSHTQIKGGQLIINDATCRDNSHYQCLTHDATGFTGYANVTLNITEEPNSSVAREVVNTAIDRTAKLKCSFNAATESVITWRRNDEKIDFNSEQRKYSMYKESSSGKNTSVLIVKDINSSDLKGLYDCSAADSNLSISFELTLAPEPPKLHAQQTVGDLVDTIWKIRSYKPLQEVEIQSKQTKEDCWKIESSTDFSNDVKHPRQWKITFGLDESPDLWHVRVRSRNNAGWSKFTYKTIHIDHYLFADDFGMEDENPSDVEGSEEYDDEVAQPNLKEDTLLPQELKENDASHKQTMEHITDVTLVRNSANTTMSSVSLAVSIAVFVSIIRLTKRMNLSMLSL